MCLRGRIELTDRVLVTGGTAGLGRETARVLAGAGWDVVITGRGAEPVRQAAAGPGHRGAAGTGVAGGGAAVRAGAAAGPGGGLQRGRPGVTTHTPARSAAGLARLVLAPSLAGMTGRYFSGRRETHSARESDNQAIAADLWTGSEEPVGA